MHLKRSRMPGFWPMGLKENKFVVNPRAGPHAKESCFPLMVIVRDILGVVQDSAEGSKAIKAGSIMVDKRPVKDPNYPVGLMDVVEIPDMKKAYRVVPSKKGLDVVEIKADDSSKKLCRVNSKQLVKGGKYQVTLHDGRNVLCGKDCKYNVGDSLLVELPDQKVLKHFGYKVGEPAIIFSGRNVGMAGKIKTVHERKTMVENATVEVETKDGLLKTSKEYVLVGEMK